MRFEKRESRIEIAFLAALSVCGC